MNWKWFIFFLLFAFGLIALLGIASAIDYDVTPTPTPIFLPATSVNMTEHENRTYEIHRIGQGDKVYLGDHIDISGVVAGNRALAWWSGGDPTPELGPEVVPLPDNKVGYYDFYVDPDVFGPRPGWWDKWNGYFERAGNTRAFYVVAMYRNSTMTYSNGTVVNVSEIQSGNYTAPTPTPTPMILPEKYVTDYLAVKGQSLNITTSGPSKMWVFGRVNGIYDQNFPDNQSVLDGHQINDLETGRYTVLIQYPGKNTIYEASYNPVSEQIESPWGKTLPVDLKGIQPRLAADYLVAFLKNTDDPYVLYNLDVQEPMIQLISMEQVSTGSAKEYYRRTDLRGNVSLFDIRGYTNVMPGTNIRFALDEYKQVKKIQWFNGTVQGENLSNMRFFRVYVPVYWDDLAKGNHTISGYTDAGGSIYRDFFVRISDEHSYIPNNTVKWLDDRNPYIPPETVTVTVPVTVVKVTYVPVPPSDEQVKAQQIEAERIVKAEQDAKWNETIKTVAIVGVVLVVIGLIGYYLYTVYRRARL